MCPKPDQRRNLSTKLHGLLQNNVLPNAGKQRPTGAGRNRCRVKTAVESGAGPMQTAQGSKLAARRKGVQVAVAGDNTCARNSGLSGVCSLLA